MTNRKSTLKLVYAAMFTAIGVALPLAFHAIPDAGNVFLPMHIPVLLCGLMCGNPYGVCCGFLTPVLGNLLINMPAAGNLPAMLGELAVYGFITALLMRIFKKRTALHVYAALIAAMLSGRLVYGIINSLVLSRGAYSLKIWAAASFITALPGIAIQLILIPSLYFTLTKRQKP